MEDWDAQKILDLYIHDYLVRKNLHNVADTFAKEANFCPKSVAINPPDGFLTEWWSIFWDMYNATMAKNPEQGEMLVSQAKQMIASMGGNVPTNMSMPDMSSLMMQNANPAMMRLPELPNMVQPVNPLLMSRPDIGSLNLNPSTSIMPMLEQNPNRLGPASVIDFSSRQGHGMTNYLEAIMREQELHRSQARDFNFNSQLLNIDQLACMMPSSSTPRRAQKALSINTQPPVNRVPVNISGTILRRPAPLPAVPKPSGTRALQINTEHANNGVGGVGDQVSADEFPSTVISHVQKDSQTILAEKAPGQLMFSSSGSSNNSGTPILVDGVLMEKNPASGDNEYYEKPLEDDVESFFSNEVPDDLSLSQENRSAIENIWNQGFQFEEVICLRPTENKLLCCDFSTPLNFLAAAGHDKKVYIMNVRNATYESVQGHEQIITDVRFKPSSNMFATSSFDRTVKIWDAGNPGKELWSLVGHDEHVMSLDFHPIKFSFMCSCDRNGEIRFWDVNKAACRHTIKGADRHVRFHPGISNLLAAANGNIINLIDIETGGIQCRFEGHTSDVNSLCWDMEGRYLVSTSEDSARVWTIQSGPKSVHELYSAGNRFASCTLHPAQTQMVVVGSYQAIDIWSPAMGNRTWNFGKAHEGLVSALARSSKTNAIASVGHDRCIKIWKGHGKKIR